MPDRIDKIQQMILKEPNDVFLRYSLGMEYAGANRFSQAVEAFEQAIGLDADYLPAYVEAGKCLRAGGDLAGARRMFRQAIKLAESQGQTHVGSFVRQQLEGLLAD